MKTKAILATLLIAAASADARFAWTYPPKALLPDEIGHWVVINANAWPKSAEPELTFTKQGVNGSNLQNDPRFKALIQISAAPVASK